MAKKTAAKKLTSREKELSNQVRTLARETSKLRLTLADVLGGLGSVEERMKRVEASAKEERTKLSGFIKDPLFSVPQHLQRKVGDLEVRVSSFATKMAGRASVDQVDRLKSDVAELRRTVTETEETVGDHHDRLVLLEDAATSPQPHASPPAHPSAKAPEKADPRQTTLDESIARAKAKGETGQMVGGLKDDPLDPGARPLRDPTPEEEAEMDAAVIPPPEAEGATT